MLAARLVLELGNIYDLIPLVFHALAVSGVFKGGYWAMPLSGKKSVFNKRKNRKTWLAPYIYLFKQFSQAFKCGHKLILVDSSHMKRL